MPTSTTIPTNDKLDAMLFPKLCKLCDKAGVSYNKRRATSNSLKKRLITFRNAQSKSKNPANKRTHRSNVRNKLPPRKKQKNGDKNKSKKKRKKKQKQIINVKGPPFKSFHPSVFFEKKSFITDDFDCSIVKLQTVLHLNYRNKHHLVVCITKEDTLPNQNSIITDIVIGKMVFRWRDTNCIEENNIEGICEAVFDILANQKPRGFCYCSFVPDSKEAAQYQKIVAQKNIKVYEHLVAANKKGSPLDANTAPTVRDAIEFIDVIFDVAGTQLKPKHFSALNNAKNCLLQMIEDKRFYSDTYNKIFNGLRQLVAKYEIDMNKTNTNNDSNTNNKKNFNFNFEFDESDNENDNDENMSDNDISKDNNISNHQINNNKSNDKNIESEINNNKSKNKTSTEKKTRKKKKLDCRYCLKSFDSGYDLNTHTNDKHKDENDNLECDDPSCENVFQDDERLREHSKRKHNTKIELHIKHKGCARGGELVKRKCYSGGVLWKRWGMKKKNK